jgi:hypothetical protein
MSDWQNRIIGHGEEAPEQLLASPRNWRIHTRQQQEALDELLKRVGWVQTVVVNQTTGHVVDGHLRVVHAIGIGEPTIPVSYVDLTEDEEALVLATLDPIAELAVVDDQALASLVEEIHGGLGPRLQDLMSDLAGVDLRSELSQNPSPDGDPSALPASDEVSDPQSPLDGSEASDGPRLLEVTCPHCAADFEANLDQLREGMETP